MILLAIDSAGESCSAALWDQAKPAPEALLAWRLIEPARGRAERLVELVEEVLTEAGMHYGALGALAVNHGPGSFTGLRCAVAAARGLALAAGLGVVPVNGLEALARGVRPQGGGDHLDGEVLAALDARRGEVYAQRFGCDLMPRPGPLRAPCAMLPQDVAASLAAGPIAGTLRLVGSGADLVQAHLPAGFPAVARRVQVDARLVAACAAQRLAAGERPLAGFAVRPLYLRAPDARPPAPVRVRRHAMAAF